MASSEKQIKDVLLNSKKELKELHTKAIQEGDWGLAREILNITEALDLEILRVKVFFDDITT